MTTPADAMRNVGLATRKTVGQWTLLHRYVNPRRQAAVARSRRNQPKTMEHGRQHRTEVPG